MNMSKPNRSDRDRWDLDAMTTERELFAGYGVELDEKPEQKDAPGQRVLFEEDPVREWPQAVTR